MPCRKKQPFKYKYHLTADNTNIEGSYKGSCLTFCNLLYTKG